MLRIDNNKIILTRGDSAFFDVKIKDNNDALYELQDGDKLIFTLKNSPQDKEFIFQKQIEDLKIILDPCDTAELSYGTYCYDLQLVTPRGDVFTIIEPSIFVIGGEVTWNW